MTKIPNTTTSLPTQLINTRSQSFARVIWLVVSGAAVLMFAARYYYLVLYALTLCTTPLEQCPSQFSLTPQLVEGLTFFGLPQEFWALHIGLLELSMMLTYLFVGGLIFGRRSTNIMPLIASGMLVQIGANVGLASLVEVPIPNWEWFSGTVGILVQVSMVLFACTFPDGRFVPPWSVWLVVASLSWELARRLLGISVVAQGFNLEVLLTIGVFLLLGCTAQVYRYYRISNTEQRQQTRWVMISAVLAFLGYFISASIYFGVLPQLTIPTLLLNIFFRVTFFASLFVLPVGIAFSVLRYRLYEVDLVINRSLVYGVLAVGLVVLFITSTVALQALFGFIGTLFAFGGREELSAVLSTAAVVLAFNPARRWLQHLIDVHFFGLRYDLNQLQAAHGATTPVPQDDAPKSGTLSGTNFGTYPLGTLLGKGGMSEVYSSSDHLRPLAVKVISEALMYDQDARARFEREAKMIASLRHNNIVRIYDFGLHDERYFMVMEQIGGIDTQHLIQTRGHLPIEEVRWIVRQLAEALDYAHELGLVHRDIKASNVMIQAPPVQAEQPLTSGRVVLMDFGIAKIITDNNTHLTTQSGMMGTLEYAAPEQIRAARYVDHRADIYALGVMTYQMLAGQMPFQGGVGQVVFAHLQQPPPDVRDVRPEVPDRVALAIMRAMSKDPTDRYDSAGEFAQAFD
jgi:hypothetical protein